MARTPTTLTVYERYGLNPELLFPVAEHIYTSPPEAPRPQLRYLSIMKDLTATTKYLDKHNVTYVIGMRFMEETKEDRYDVFVGHYSTIEYREMVRICHNGFEELGNDFVISGCLSFTYWKHRDEKVVHGNLADFDKYPADMKTQWANDEKIERERSHEAQNNSISVEVESA